MTQPPLPAFTVKVCGLTRPGDVALCHELGVDMTGFIFAAASPRLTTIKAALAAPRGKALRVGVFVEQTLDDVLRIMHAAELDLAQLHGGQDPDFCRAVGASRVMRAFWPARYDAPETLQAELKLFAGCCRLFLFDAGTAGGGHGKTLDLDFLHGVQSPLPWLLAGGLGPENLASALTQASPNGVDLNSRVESAPGVKDHDKLRDALAIVKTSRGSAPDPAGGGDPLRASSTGETG
jgi:phosphoribosylanthranilate isomerase